MVYKAMKNAFRGLGLNSLVIYPDFSDTTTPRLRVRDPIRRIRVDIDRRWNLALHTFDAQVDSNYDEDGFLRRPPFGWNSWASSHLPEWYLYGAFFCSRAQIDLFQQPLVPTFRMPDEN